MKILIVDLVHQILLTELTKAGFKCDYQPDILGVELQKILYKYNGLIIRSKIKLTKEILSKNTHLKFIGRVGSGLESIDIEYANEIGIKCMNSPEGNRTAVGEHAVGLILSLFNNICKSQNEVRNGIWQREPNRGFELSGKTVGIIGYGNTGTAFAKCLQGFDVKVIAYDKYKLNYSNSYAKAVTMPKIYEQTDILSLHVPLTNETKFMVNSKFLNKFKKNIYLINTSRGKVVNTNELVAELKSGKIFGAVLDVLEYEKITFEKLVNSSASLQYLQNSKKVILTPHIAGLTKESNIKLSKVIAKKIKLNFAK